MTDYDALADGIVVGSSRNLPVPSPSLSTEPAPESAPRQCPWPIQRWAPVQHCRAAATISEIRRAHDS